MDCWERIAHLAPIGTASVACLALIVAIISIRVQKSVAKKRAAIDFFLKTEMDGPTLTAFSVSRPGFLLLKQGAPLDMFVESDDYPLVRNYLNIHELLAIGILNGVFDEETCLSFWGDQLIEDCSAAERLIQWIRQTPGEGTSETYLGMTMLLVKWRSGA